MLDSSPPNIITEVSKVVGLISQIIHEKVGFSTK